jgi:hypothetical protein
MWDRYWIGYQGNLKILKKIEWKTGTALIVVSQLQPTVNSLHLFAHFLMMLTVSGQMMWDVDLTKWEELNLVSLASAA